MWKIGSKRYYATMKSPTTNSTTFCSSERGQKGAPFLKHFRIEARETKFQFSMQQTKYILLSTILTLRRRNLISSFRDMYKVLIGKMCHIPRAGMVVTVPQTAQHTDITLVG